MKKVEVLYIQVPTDGGSATCLLQLLECLDKKHFKPTVLCWYPNRFTEQFIAAGASVNIFFSKTTPTEQRKPSVGQGTKKPVVWEEKIPRLRNLAISAKLLVRTLINDGHDIIRLRKYIKTNGFHIIHHNNNLNLNRVAIIASILANVIQFSHVRFIHSPYLLDCFLSRWVHGFIYMSEAIRDAYESSGIPRGKGIVVYEGMAPLPPIDSCHLERLRTELGVHGLVLSNIGRLAWWKGQDIFLESVADLRKTYSGDLTVLVVGPATAGSAGKTFLDRLYKIVGDNKMEDIVRFTGLRSDIPAILMLSDIVIHSATMPEPFGRVLVEAMMAGKPLIATAAGGPIEIVDHEKTGLLVTPGSSRAMTSALLRLATDEQFRTKLGKQARLSALEKYSNTTFIQAIETLYNKAIKFL